MNKKLCEEYKEQLIKVEGQIKIKQTILNNSEDGDISIIKEIDDLYYFKSNLKFGIKWMEQCHAPGVYQGIDNLKATDVY